MSKPCKYCKKKMDRSNPRLGGFFCSPKCKIYFKNPPKEIETGYSGASLPDEPIKQASKGVKIEKKKVFRSEKYKAFVRTFPCCVCGSTPVHAHHVDGHGMAIKGSDLTVIPLCPAHHNSDSGSIHEIGLDKFEKVWDISIEEVQNRLLKSYIESLFN